ncbi:uncharacterized conserved protein [Moesziomyces antarcticus T-34]|uniref:Polynucleotide 5'-hydroxyl-kinase GRC3 n=1 Tax=Pseudozyma antarctica (strain T-34) TaxID=1151754 RepID=M9LT15_PSEA3|nr:uncharacterized conserved protein [Moesziomyces antarcticus T-34]
MAPVSAYAAREARRQAEAQKSTPRRPSGAAANGKDAKQTSTSTPSRSSRRASSGKHATSSQQDDASGVEVVIAPLTPSQTLSLEASWRAAAATPAKASRADLSSASKRARRSSTTQQPDSVAATRPRRNSVASATERTPKSAKQAIASSTTPQKSTPGRRASKSISAAASTSSTPASSSKKRKSSGASARDQAEDELEQAVQEIIDELRLGKADDSDSESEQPPPRKKHAGRAASVPKSKADQAESSQAASSKPSASKRTTAAATPAKTTPKGKAETARATPAKKERATPAKKERAKPAPKTGESSASKQRSLFATPDQSRIKAVRRYFAGSAGKPAKSNVGPSDMPVEDPTTGFLAFADDDSDDASSPQEDAATPQAESQSDDSSDDEAGQADAQAGSVPNVRRRKPEPNQSPARSNKPQRRRAAHADESDVELIDAQAEDPPALTRDALLDAIPYSHFEAVLDGQTPNTVVKENKKRSKEALYFGLRHDETLSLLGIGCVRVLRGCVQIGGAVLSTSDDGFQSAKVHAPICNALPVLRCVPPSRLPGHQAAGTDASQSEDANDAEAVPLFAQPFDAIIKLTPLTSPITALGQVCPIGGLATPFSAPSNLELGNLHQLATVKVLLAPDVDQLANRQKRLTSTGAYPTAGLSATYLPHAWQNALHRLATSALSAAQHPQEESVVALIRGNRKVGKSTLSRMALERILSLGSNIGGAVAYLELDLGQSDFGPPGMVALHVFKREDASLADQGAVQAASEHATSGTGLDQNNVNGDRQVARGACVTLGPGWCQPRVPARAHFVGDVSPRDDPESYVAAVHDLIDYFRTHIQPGQADAAGIQQRVPLVINTQGWIKGLGADLAARLEPLLRPTHILDVNPRGSSGIVPPPTRGPRWLDIDGAILGAGPEIAALESVSQLEFASSGPADAEQSSRPSVSAGTSEQTGTGDGGATPPRYVTEVASKLAPTEARLLTLMSYLYAQGLAPASSFGAAVRGTWNFTEPLVHRLPLVVDVDQGLKAGIRVLALGSSVPDSLKLMAINASIVAITVSDSGSEAVDDDVAVDAAQKDGQVVNTWKRAFDRAARIVHSGERLSSRCVGLGIVRSIDVDAGHVHLLTPVDPEFLGELQLEAGGGRAIGLVKGAVELPVWASLDLEAIREARESRLNVVPALGRPGAAEDAEGGERQASDEPLLAGMPRNQVPYLEWPHVANLARLNTKSKRDTATDAPLQLGSEKRRVRRNLMRKSQFA